MEGESFFPGGEVGDGYGCWDHVPDQLVLVCLDWL
jgi:hypothetical protein